MSDMLRLTSLCNRSGVPAIDQPQLIYVLSEIFPEGALAIARLPLNFALVLDQSGSMGGEKIRTMREAVKNILDQLNTTDIVSMVTFETKPHILVDAKPAEDKDGLKRQVEKIREGGGTNVSRALKEALRLVRQYHSPERVSRVILLTDGEATDKVEDSQALASEAGQYGIPIVGLGFGKDWNEDFLIDLSDRSILAEPGSHSGFTDYIPTPNEATKIFQEVYQSMQVVAQNVQVTIRMVQGLEARRVWQVVPIIKDIGRDAIHGRAITIQIAELEKTGAAYLAEIMLPPRPPGIVRIAQTDITYSIPGRGDFRHAVDLLVEFSNDPQIYNQMNGRVMNVVEKIQAFKLQTQALGEVESGNVAGATQKLRQAVTILLSQGEDELAKQMQQEASLLEKSGELSSEGKKTIKLSSRKTVRLDDPSAEKIAPQDHEAST